MTSEGFVAMWDTDVLFTPTKVGSVTVANRFVRAGTAETMATPEGSVTPQLVTLYEELARNRVGLIFTGHMFVHPRGRGTNRQTGIHDDGLVEGLRQVTSAVHRHDGRIFAQLGHAGPQSKVVADLLSPSRGPNLMTGRVPERAASEDEIEEAIAAFGKAAARAVEGGFDGVHIHGANGYLISSFASPYANRRTDRWGGSAEGRSELGRRVAEEVRRSVPAGFPVTMKLGFVDAAPEGVTLGEAVERAVAFARVGLDGIEVSSNLIATADDSARRFAGIDQRRALRDLIFERVDPEAAPEAYFLPYARALRAEAPDIALILVGGLRSLPVMAPLVATGAVDLLSMARPFIREPDLVERLRSGRAVAASCTSCNLCYQRSARYSLRCWRKPRYRLAHSLLLRLIGR